MNIGWVSATPLAKTGYGTQTMGVCDRLVERHNVVCIGQTGDVVVWGGRQVVGTPRGNQLQCLPLVDMGSAPQIIQNLYAQEFDFDVIVGFMDAFGIEYLNHLDLPVIGWIPIDGPFTEKWANCVRNFHRIVAYSRFGYKELRKFFPPSRIDYVPHAIPLDYAPQGEKTDEATRSMLNQKYGIPEDAFLVVNVGANVGPRKEMPLMMKTFARFVNEGHDDAHLYLHTNAHAPWPKGYDLITWRRMIEMEEHIHFPVHDPILVPYSDSDLAKIYSTADVYWQNSVAEGFGLPIAESMACGTPVIIPNNSAQKEFLTYGEEGDTTYRKFTGNYSRGVLAESVPRDIYEQIPVYVPQLPNYPVPDQYSMLNAIRWMYDYPDRRKQMGIEANKYIEEHHRWDGVIHGWFRILEDVEEEIGMFESLKDSFAPIST